MKKAVLLFSLLMASTSIQAQTITLGPITKLAYCVGDTLFVPYQASGTFAGDNYFVLQLSDSSGSFSNFKSFGNDTAKVGTFALRAEASGTHFRIRIISADPYIISADNGNDISVFALPSPQISIRRESNGYVYSYSGDAVGFTGEEFTIFDASKESAGSIYHWQYDSLSGFGSSMDSSVHLSFATDGSKNISLQVTDQNGCSTTVSTDFLIASCEPIIPHNARVVTGNSAINFQDSAIWVRAGGTLTGTGKDIMIFAEPGSSLMLDDLFRGLCYLRQGALFNVRPGSSHAGIIMTPDRNLSFGNDLTQFDTLYCPDLTFDYSQVNASVAQPEAPSISIRQAGDALFVEGEENIEARVLNLLGAEMLSKRGAGALDLDLSPLPAGIYFAIVQAGDAREVKRIAVVH